MVKLPKKCERVLYICDAPPLPPWGASGQHLYTTGTPQEPQERTDIQGNLGYN
nr:MAG TPA: hypothetical protein [Caudoviricetes sp.]